MCSCEEPFAVVGAHRQFNAPNRIGSRDLDRRRSVAASGGDGAAGTVHLHQGPFSLGPSDNKSDISSLCQAQKILLCVKKFASEPDTLMHADDTFTYARGAPLSTEGALTLSEAYFSTVHATQACSQSKCDTCSGQSHLPHQGCTFVLHPSASHCTKAPSFQAPSA